MKRSISVLLAAIAVVGTGTTVEAQILRRAKERVQTEIERRIKCVVGDEVCIAKARSEGKEVVLTDSSGNPVPEDQQQPASQKPGEGAWANYDFVPGERILFDEDFSLDVVGDFPRRMEFKSGALEIVEWNGARWMRATQDSRFFLVLPETLPSRFTLEFDYAIPAGEVWIYFGELQSRLVKFGGQGIARLENSDTEISAQGRYESGGDPNTIRRARVLADGRYVKVYIDDKRILNVPNADLERDMRIQFWTDAEVDRPSLFSNFRVAAGGRRLYDALNETGRVATQGIFFDTGSDQLQPESSPTLKEIGAMLTQHPDLRLLIEGHTDSVGDDASNLALSQKRADAVRQFLCETYGIDTARLETKGMGETQPADSNDTAEGRQNNRRVELVRLDGAP
jgi:outer membrane protein OmpA-like peptidoglycan-associated protein